MKYTNIGALHLFSAPGWNDQITQFNTDKIQIMFSESVKRQSALPCIPS